MEILLREKHAREYFNVLSAFYEEKKNVQLAIIRSSNFSKKFMDTSVYVYTIFNYNIRHSFRSAFRINQGIYKNVKNISQCQIYSDIAILGIII